MATLHTTNLYLRFSWSSSSMDKAFKGFWMLSWTCLLTKLKGAKNYYIFFFFLSKVINHLFYWYSHLFDTLCYLYKLTLTLEYIHVVFVTLTPTPGRTYPVYTPLNEIIKIIKCDLNWSQCDLRGPSWVSSTITNRLQVISNATLTDIKKFHFGDFYF